MTILALTPVEEEFEALTSSLVELGLFGEERAIGRKTGIMFGRGGLFVAQGGLGKAQFGITTQHLLDHMEGVRLMVCAGTAGGLVPSLSVADVIAATQTVEHDFNRTLIQRPKPSFEGDANYLSHIRNLQTSLEGFSIHFGPVASGDEGIADESRAREIHEATGGLAVAWEGAGGARAAQFSGVPFLEMRGITDAADEDAYTDFFQNIPLAMHSIARILHGLMRVGSP